MPRAYKRKTVPLAEDGAKARIIQAACDLLLADEGFAGFTVEAVARQADVARATIYYQFGSKSGLLEAVLDEVAARSIIQPFELVTSRAGQPHAFQEMVKAVAAFWAAERALNRRFYGLAALDPDVRRSVAARDEQRRMGARAIVEGHLRRNKRWSAKAEKSGAAIVDMLLRFESFDVLAGDAPLESAAPIITHLILSALDGPRSS
jgi:AcrR family transcriptional regulator